MLNVLKENNRACAAIGHSFVVQVIRLNALLLPLTSAQLHAIYMDMLLVYKAMSENVALAIASAG